MSADTLHVKGETNNRMLSNGAVSEERYERYEPTSPLRTRPSDYRDVRTRPVPFTEYDLSSNMSSEDLELIHEIGTPSDVNHGRRDKKPRDVNPVTPEKKELLHGLVETDHHYVELLNVTKYAED